MKTFLTIVITAIVVVAFFVLTGRYKPMWLIKLEFDKNGFPYLKKEGDLFILKNIVYWYHNGIWVQLDSNGFPIAPAPKIDDTFVKNGTSYTFTDKGWVLTPTGPGNPDNASRIGGILILNRNGFPVDLSGAIIGQRIPCKEGSELIPYPEGSKYYGYYYCGVGFK